MGKTLKGLCHSSILNILTVNNIYRHQTLKFIHNWHKQRLPSIIQAHFQYTKNVHNYNTRYSSKDNLYKRRFGTATGKKNYIFNGKRTLAKNSLPSQKISTPTFLTKKTQRFHLKWTGWLTITIKQDADWIDRLN